MTTTEPTSPASRFAVRTKILRRCQLRMVSRMSMPSRIEVVNGSARARSSDRIALAIFFDHQILGRIRTDGLSGGLLCPFTGKLFTFAWLQARRFQALLGAGKPA